MSGGIRAEVRIHRPPGCLLASAGNGGTIQSIRTAKARDDGKTVTEFVSDEQIDWAEKVFDYGTSAVYRVATNGHDQCVCDRVESLGYPVRDKHVEDSCVVLTFFVPDIAALRECIDGLQSETGSVDVRRLTRSDEATSDEFVFVDRGALTDRQQEVLEVANRMGYFEHPKEANAGDVADELGITRATFTEHLSAAQRKLLGTILD